MHELIAVFTPLLLASLLWFPRARFAPARYLLPVAPLPALLFAVAGDGEGSTVLSWLFLESRLGLAFAGPVYLFFTATLWALAGWFGAVYLSTDSKSPRFVFFWLATLTGNLGLTLSGDAVSFYCFFAIMSLSASGLVLHTGAPEARRAGRIYIILAVIGEVILASAMLLALSESDSWILTDVAAAVASSPWRDGMALLFLIGFGIKAGIVPLHFWLPLAHPVAPTPASAVLSGAMIKAGLLGWLHLLPGGAGDFVEWGQLCMALGMLTAFTGAACGYYQENPKTLLAYSSVSQMGVMLATLGAGFAQSAAWSASAAALAAYALNHGLCKGSLFLGVGAVASTPKIGYRSLRMLGLALPAISLAGAPLMGGSVVKYALKSPVSEVAKELAPWMLWLLPLSAMATALLMGKFLVLMWRRMGERNSGACSALLWPWIASVLAAAFGVRIAAPFYEIELAAAAPGWQGIWASFWPLLVGGAALLLLGRRAGKEPIVPAGDIVAFLEGGARRIGKAREAMTLRRPPIVRIASIQELKAKHPKWERFLRDAERQARAWPLAMAVLLALILAMVMAL